jgi:hypothetical protein
VRDFGGDKGTTGAGGVSGRWDGFAASSPTAGSAVDVVSKLGSLGAGKSAGNLV